MFIICGRSLSFRLYYSYFCTQLFWDWQFSLKQNVSTRWTSPRFCIFFFLSRVLKMLLHSCNAMMEFPIWPRKKRQICCEGLECGFWLLSLLLRNVCSQNTVTFPSHATYFILHEVTALVKAENINSLSDLAVCKSTTGTFLAKKELLLTVEYMYSRGPWSSARKLHCYSSQSLEKSIYL